MSDTHTFHLHLLLLSGELLPEQEEAIREHHHECSLCRADLEQVQQVLHHYRALPQARVAPEVLAGLQRSARQAVLPAWQAGLQRLLHVEWRWLQATALTAAIVVLAVLIARSNRAISRHEPVTAVTSLEVEQGMATLQHRLAALSAGRATAMPSDPGRNTFDALFDRELGRVRHRMQEWTNDLIFSETQ